MSSWREPRPLEDNPSAAPAVPKTLSGFLPALIAGSLKKPTDRACLKVLYISPLRALTNDIQRNLTRPIEEMKLPITLGVRTGDTKSYQRTKQRKIPPDILLTTPESLMLLDLVIIDELHSFATNKRGDFTSLALARLKTLAPNHIRFGLSATISKPEDAAQWLGPSGSPAKLLEVTSRGRSVRRLSRWLLLGNCVRLSRLQP